MSDHKPTPTHHFMRLLHDKGVLLRVFTQNIDSLESAAGIAKDKIVAAHGNCDGDARACMNTTLHLAGTHGCAVAVCVCRRGSRFVHPRAYDLKCTRPFPATLRCSEPGSVREGPHKAHGSTMRPFPPPEAPPSYVTAVSASLSFFCAAAAHCIECHAEAKMEDVQAAMAAGEPMKCRRCKWGLVKPDIVFYGEELPARFEEVGWDGMGWDG